MGDILDLFLDFEKKLLHLIRDLVIRPKVVAESIAAKDKAYLGSFKFYSIVTSLWIIIFQLTNPYLDFFPTEFVVPQRLALFLQSQQDFIFLVAPFAGLIEFFIPFGIINYFLFYNKKFSWFNHITLNIYLGGILMLYELPVFLILYLIGTNNIFVYLLVFLVPAIYYGYVHIKIFGKKKLPSFLKPCITLVIIIYASVSIFIDQPFHETIHRKIFYTKYNQFDIKETIPHHAFQYVREDSIVFESDSENQFVAETVYGKTKDKHSFVICNYNRYPFRNHSYRFLSYDSVNLSFTSLLKDRPEPSFFSITEDEKYKDKIVIEGALWKAFSDSTSLTVIDSLGKVSSRAIFTDYVSTLSKVVRVNDSTLITGISYARRQPVIGFLTSSKQSIEGVYEWEGKKNFIVDDICCLKDGTLNLIMSHAEKGRLVEMIWIRGRYQGGKFVKQAELSLYKNEFNPTKDFFSKYLHKGSIGLLNDSTSFASFQIMTDSSFAVNLTRIDMRSNTAVWNSIVIIPADFAFNDHVIVDESSIYLLGRVASVFTKDLSSTFPTHPYIQTVDLDNGRGSNLFYFSDEEFFPEPLASIEPVYGLYSSCYQNEANIYWNINGLHSYVINKSKIR
ncbi:hypothetical protein BH09BAC3_BH09BAC3_34510 [soil metagenome]